MAGTLKLITGGAEVVGGSIMAYYGLPGAGSVIGMGASTLLSGAADKLKGNAPNGFATAIRSPIAGWNVCYGRCRVGGVSVYDHTWGAYDIMRDLVVVLACHPCASVDEVLMDQQRLQVDPFGVPTSGSAGYAITPPAAGSGTCFTPIQQTIAITGTISRASGVVTVTVPIDIPYLDVGDQITILDADVSSLQTILLVTLAETKGSAVLGKAGLTGTFPVSQIISRVPSGGTNILTFTYLNGGMDVSFTNVGAVQTKWTDYKRTIYVEPIYGDQNLGQTFIGMIAGVPWEGDGPLNSPAAQPNAQGNTAGGEGGSNPWTNFHSLQGKSACFIRAQYDDSVFKSGLPQISFHVRGKNNIYDPRLGPCTGVKVAGCSNPGTGYVGSVSGLFGATGDVIQITQASGYHGFLGLGASVIVTSVDGSGGITGYILASGGASYQNEYTGPLQSNGLGSIHSNPVICSTTGTGHGAVFAILNLGPGNIYTGYPISRVLLMNPGSGYTPGLSAITVGDELELVQAGASGCALIVTTMSATGAISSYNIVRPGRGYSLGAATVTGGHGSSATFTIQALTGASGTVTAVNASNIGTGSGGYIVGDILTILQAGSTNDAAAAVTAINPVTGAITGVSLSSPGTSGYYSASSVPTTGGHGVGAYIQIQAGANVYTENSALCIADFLSDPIFGYNAAYGTDIPIDPLISAANICDEPVDVVVGGTEPRYTLNGQFTLTQSRGAILQDMLSSCAGRITSRAPFIIYPGKWVGPGSPPLQLDLQATAAGPYEWKGPTITEQYNGCKGTHISPENKWQSTDYPAYAQDAMHGYSGPAQYGGDINLAKDLGQRRWLELHLPFTISSAMAQRIAKIKLLQARWENSGSGTFRCNLAVYPLSPIDVFEETASYVGLSNELMEVTRTRDLLEATKDGVLMSIALDARLTDPSIYDWSIDEELTPQGYVQVHYPAGTVVESAPWPWSPGYANPLAGDALGLPATFGLLPWYSTDTQGNPVLSLQVKGTPPINAVSSGISNPQFFCYPSSTGGSLQPGTYIVGVSAWDSASTDHGYTDYHNLSTVMVSGTGSGSIRVVVNWGPGDVGGSIYMAPWNKDGYTLHWQQDIADGVTSATITAFDQSTPGGPDVDFDHFGVPWQSVSHSGVWAQQVQAVTPNTITIASYIAGDVTANQWAGYTLSLLAYDAPNVEVPVLNIPIGSHTASSGTPAEFVITIGTVVGPGGPATLPDLTTLLHVGDLLVLRGNYLFTPNSFSDTSVANAYYPSGATGVEAGHVAVVMTGRDAGDMQSIAYVTDAAGGTGPFTPSNPAITFVLAGQWKTPPNTGDIVVICASGNLPEIPSAAAKYTSPVPCVVATVPLQNLMNSTWLFRVRTEDKNGQYGPDSVAPMRDLFIFGAQGTSLVTS